MDVSDPSTGSGQGLGEFALIDRLTAALGQRPPASLIVGIGDDAAAWRADDSVLLATTDTLVAGVHFLPEWACWGDLGWKALAVNVSDIAAMGGIPDFALVTLALPPALAVAAVDQLFAGLRECAEAYGVTIVGGDVVRARDTSITVALMGHAQLDEGGEPLLLRRDAARAGDAIAVTGTLGDSAAGLRLLGEGKASAHPLVRTHLRPQPPLALGQEAARRGFRCAIDLSDGLLQDLGHVCRMSGVGARLRAQDIPLSDRLRQAFPAEALALACGGGEDYQLLFAASRKILEDLRAHVDAPIPVIGETVADKGCRVRLLDEAGREITLGHLGWDHLRQP